MTFPSPEKKPVRPYWIAAAVYAAVVAIQLGGFWTVLNFALILFSARQGFAILHNLITMAQNTEVMEQLKMVKRNKELLGTLALTAVLYVVAVPLASPLPAYLATAVVWAGALYISRPATDTSKKAVEGGK